MTPKISGDACTGQDFYLTRLRYQFSSAVILWTTPPIPAFPRESSTSCRRPKLAQASAEQTTLRPERSVSDHARAADGSHRAGDAPDALHLLARSSRQVFPAGRAPATRGG